MSISSLANRTRWPAPRAGCGSAVCGVIARALNFTAPDPTATVAPTVANLAAWAAKRECHLRALPHPSKRVLGCTVAIIHLHRVSRPGTAELGLAETSQQYDCFRGSSRCAPKSRRSQSLLQPPGSTRHSVCTCADRHGSTPPWQTSLSLASLQLSASDIRHHHIHEAPI